MPIKIFKDKFTKRDLLELAHDRFGDMVKGVVDVTRKIVALGGELHADEEAVLLQDGSKQENLWGINLYPEVNAKDFIEFDSMINLRPRQGNMTRGVENPQMQELITKIINELYSH